MDTAENAHAATSEDLAALTILAAAARAELSGMRGGDLLTAALAGPAGPEAALQRTLDDPDRLLLVGRLGEVPVGFAAVRCDRFAGQTVGVIEALYVEPAARKVGVGEALVDETLRWCGARGCEGVDAPTLPGARQAKAFFEDNGFVARLLVMHHRIRGDRP